MRGPAANSDMTIINIFGPVEQRIQGVETARGIYVKRAISTNPDSPKQIFLSAGGCPNSIPPSAFVSRARSKVRPIG
jgi:hypothetical protein